MRFQADFHIANNLNQLAAAAHIRLNPDSSPSRFQDVPIFGGEHGDVPLTDTMGAVLGKLVTELRRNGLIETHPAGFVLAEALR